MQKWLISADTKKWNPAAFFAECGFVDWEKRNNYEIGDIVYIYCKQPVGKIMFKTFVKEMSSHNNSNEDWVIFELMEYKDTEDLSLENLRKYGLNNAPMKPMKLNGKLEKYVDNCFVNDLNINNENHRFWIVNAGKDGVKLQSFLDHNFIGIGSPFTDLSGKSRDEIKLICEEGNEDSANCLYKADAFANQIKFGDFILTKDFSNDEFYLGKCTSNYYYSEKMDDSNDDIKFSHCRDVVWLDVTLKRDDISEKYLKYIETPKSLQEIKNDGAINEILNFYNFNFLSNEKRNLIYFGAPGTGKSYNLNEHMDKFLKKYEDNIENNYERVTFHPDYTFANFVGTYKPVPKEKLIYTPIPQDESVDYKPIMEDAITYQYVPGPFMRTLVKALKNPYEPFILIIEEINRSNIAAVFGDVFQLLDRDQLFNSEYPINASEDLRKYILRELNFQNIPEYRQFTLKNHLNSLFGERFEKISIPSNMFIWATMNSADQGVYPMDTAFKRRWDFEYLGINDGAEKIENVIIEVPESWNIKNNKLSWNDLRVEINKELLRNNINEDKLIGPFFAFNEYTDNDLSFDKFVSIFENKILMYLFEDAARPFRKKFFEKNDKESYLTYSMLCDKFRDDGVVIFNERIQKKFIKDIGE